MTSCLCNRCSKTPSAKYSAEWILETEARLILTMPIDGRRKYLNRLKGVRRAVLEAEIKRQWAQNKLAKNVNVV